MAVKQAIPSNTNQTKSLTFSKLRGVDYSSSPFEVSASRAVHMKNMINEDGVNHKRPGWSENNEHSKFIKESKFDVLLDVCCVNLSVPTENRFIPVYLYSGVKDNTVVIKPKLKTSDETIFVPESFEYACTLDEHNFNCFENNGSAYTLGCGEYNKISIIFSEKEEFDYELSIESSESFAYVPTTALSVNNKYDLINSGDVSSVFEDANVLTSKRKNSFIIGEKTRQYNIAFEVHEMYRNEYSKVTFRITNNTTNVVTEVDATNKDYVVAQLQEGSYKFRVICDGKEDTVFAMNEFNPKIANNKSSSIKINGIYYWWCYELRQNYSITINGNTYSLPHMAMYSDVSSDHYQITYWYKNYDINSYGQLVEQATLYTDSGYSPNYSYFNNTVYEFDTKVKKNSIARITIKSKYDLNSKKLLYEPIEYSVDVGVGGEIYNKINILYKEKEFHIGFINSERIILTDNNLSPILEGADNMLVEFQVEESNYTGLVKKCKYGKTFAFTGHTDRLFAYGNEDYPATMYFTGSEGFDYFPYINYNVIGSNNNEISGLSILTDSTIAVHKKNNYKEASIYYLTAENVTLDNKNKVAFVTSTGTLGETPVNPSVCHNMAGDNLILSENGVYSIQAGTNIKISERFAYERSGLINSFLSKLSNQESAVAIAYKNRYYLAIDDIVLIADARFKSSARDSDMNDTFNYEWWHWENMPVKKWVVIDEQLHFISNNGVIAEFTDKFTDETLTYLSNGDWTDLKNSDNYIQLNLNYSNLLKNGNKLIANNIVYEITDVNISAGTFRLKDFEGNIVNTQGAFYSNFNNSFYICDYKNVVSEWYTPIINMGTDLFSKNLLSSTLVFEPNIEGNVKFGYLTRKRDGTIFKESALSPSNGLDFSNIDFTDFSFAVGFAASRTLKTRVRNFNYIQFRIVSDTNEDCALNHFTITYNIGRKNKGVR